MIDIITRILKMNNKSKLLLWCFFASCSIIGQNADPVTNLMVTEGVANQFTVNWDAPTGGDTVTGYNMFIQPQGASGLTYITTISASSTSYVYSGNQGGVNITDGGVYSITIQTLPDNDGNNYVAIPDFSLNTPDPSAPTGLTITDGNNPNEFVLSWDADAAAFGGFNVFLNGGSNYIATVSPGVNSFTFTAANGINDGATYNPAVQALPDGDNSAYANINTPEINTYNWIGGTSDDWGTVSNWDRNVVPSSPVLTVNIPSTAANLPTASSAVLVNKLVVNSGASFIPQAGVTGTITYKRELTSNWHLIASPVLSETKQAIISNHVLATGTGNNIGLAPYNNTMANPWQYETSSSMGDLTAGLGYSIKLATAGEVMFSGTPNGNVNLPVSVGMSPFNLIGNPYTSYIDLATFLTANSSKLSEQTAWFWDGNQYVTYNVGSSINIAPGQGFFVSASGNDNISFSTGDQIHKTSNTFLKQEPIASFELFAESGDVVKSTKVSYINGKTIGFDNGYDSKMFDGVTQNFGIYTELLSGNSDKKLAIQTLPKEDIESMIIPVGLISEENEEIKFSAKVKNLPADVNLYLEDRLKNEFINLTEQDYIRIVGQKTNNIGQFYIHISSKKIESNDLVSQAGDVINFYKLNRNELVIKGVKTKVEVFIYNMLGKKLVTKKLTKVGESTVDVSNLSTGVYIVSLSSASGNLRKKVILE